MAKSLTCPCGELIIGANDDAFVSAVDAHLQAVHEGRTYPASMILQMASPYPDDQVPG